MAELGYLIRGFQRMGMERGACANNNRFVGLRGHSGDDRLEGGNSLVLLYHVLCIRHACGFINNYECIFGAIVYRL